MAYVYENCKLLYVSRCHCHFSGNFCYEIDLFKCTTIMKEETERNNMNSQELDILTKFCGFF